MKKYEYKYVKSEAKLNFGGTEMSYPNDEAMLTGFGLEGWRVNSLMHPFYLLEREVPQSSET